MNYPEKVNPVTPCVDLYKENIQYYLSIDKLKLTIIVRGDLQNKEIIGDTWYPKVTIITLNYLLLNDYKHKEKVHQLYFIGAFLQAKVKYRVFVKLDSRYGE